MKIITNKTQILIGEPDPESPLLTSYPHSPYPRLYHIVEIYHINKFADFKAFRTRSKQDTFIHNCLTNKIQ